MVRIKRVAHRSEGIAGLVRRCSPASALASLKSVWGVTEGAQVSRFAKVGLSAVLAFLSLPYLFAESPFVMVMYDSRTERSLGSFPPSRAQYASAVSILKGYGAKAIVVKYFLDLPKDAPGDAAFADSMKGIPVFLQACIDNTEAHPNRLDSRFAVQLRDIPGRVPAGNSGWTPLEQFSTNAYDVGFVDMRRADLVPLFERYQQKIYRTLWLSVLQYALPGLHADGKYLANGRKKLAINEYGEVPVHYPREDKLDYISFGELIRKDTDKSRLEAKVVIIGYDGNNSGLLDTPIGKVRAHRAFYYCLQDLYAQLQ
jgi:hypothetical protein